MACPNSFTILSEYLFVTISKIEWPHFNLFPDKRKKIFFQYEKINYSFILSSVTDKSIFCYLNFDYLNLLIKRDIK
jgi:hypothetical protein